MIPTLLLTSLLVFIIIELPPGDYVTNYVRQMEDAGYKVDEGMEKNLRELYGLDSNMAVRYLKWVGNLARGNMGYSLLHKKPVSDVLVPRFGVSAAISLSAMILTYTLGIPLGFYSAVKKNTLGDYSVTFIAYLGMSVPGFIMGILLLYVNSKFFGQSVGGFFSNEFKEAAWSMAKFKDLLNHVWVPLLITMLTGLGGMLRGTRIQLLDELKKPYVEYARAKGLSEGKMLVKYPFRVAINPTISGMAGVLSSLVGGDTILSMVLCIPTAGPIVHAAVMKQDMQLAGSYLMLCSVLLLIGTLLSDIMLAVIDPRIRYE